MQSAAEMTEGKDAEHDQDFSTFALFLLDEFPQDRAFDDEGRWLGWGDCRAKPDAS